jgi:hypothetical protein
MKNILFVWVALAVCTLAGCGSDDAPLIIPVTPATPVTTAILKLSSQGTLAGGTSLSGIGVTVVLPAGVTVKTGTGGVVDASVVTISGVAVPGTLAPPVYTPATASAKATLHFVIASSVAGGFGVGEFATVTCGIASGFFPVASDFSLTSFTPADLFLQPVTGLTATFTADIH